MLCSMADPRGFSESRITPVLLPLFTIARLFISGQKFDFSRAASLNGRQVSFSVTPDNKLPQGSMQDIQPL